MIVANLDTYGVEMKNIKEWQIKSPNGWTDFKGIKCNGGKQTFNVNFEDGSSVSATSDHGFFINNVLTEVNKLKIGDVVDGHPSNKIIKSIVAGNIEEVYDIVESQEDHKFFVNDGVITKNCDEFAFVPQNIAEKFWKSNFPTLSNGGSAILVSTPNGAAGIFYEIYKDAEGGHSPFKPFKVNWWEFPGRDEKWKEEMIAAISKVGFAQEYGCFFRENTVNIEYNGKKYKIKIGDLYDYGSDFISNLTEAYEVNE